MLHNDVDWNDGGQLVWASPPLNLSRAPPCFDSAEFRFDPAGAVRRQGAPMIVLSCAIDAYSSQNAMFDIWLMLGFGVVGYVFKKISIPLAPFTLALVLGNRAEDAFRLSMIGSGGDMKVFWSNGLVGSITTLAIVLWPLIDKAFGSVDCGGRQRLPVRQPG